MRQVYVFWQDRKDKAECTLRDEVNFPFPDSCDADNLQGVWNWIQSNGGFVCGKTFVPAHSIVRLEVDRDGGE